MTRQAALAPLMKTPPERAEPEEKLPCRETMAALQGNLQLRA